MVPDVTPGKALQIPAPLSRVGFFQLTRKPVTPGLHGNKKTPHLAGRDWCEVVLSGDR